MNAQFRSEINRHERRERARDRMAAQNLDALLLTGGPNLTYLAGVNGMLGSNSGSRPLLYVLPRSGDPILIIHQLLAGEVTDDTGDVTTLTYNELSSLPAQELRDAFERRKLTDGRIGAELGPETTLSVPASDFTDFVDSLPDAEFLDAQPLLVDLRSQKSVAEVERIERACEITSEAYDRTFNDAEIGMTGTEIEALVCRHMINCGGQSPWALITSGSDNYEQIASGGDDHPITDGDMVWVDCGCNVDGYWSDYSRAGVVGGPSERQCEAQEAIHKITQNAVAAIEPGVAMSSVAAQAEEAIESLDLPITAYLSRQAGRIGHSLGVQVTELPSISMDTDWIFQPGMTVTVEPAFATDYGTFHVEENVLVTESGTRTLSDDHWRLRTI